jgi:hypothetical protein
LNQIIKSYLHAYYADEPTTWVNLLPLAQFAYNNSINTTTNTTPNNLLFGIDCNIWFHVNGIPREKIPEAHVRIKKLHELHQRLQEHLTKANKYMTKYYNQNHIPKQFKVDQLIMLSTKNLKLKHPKLAPQ